MNLFIKTIKNIFTQSFLSIHPPLGEKEHFKNGNRWQKQPHIKQSLTSQVYPKTKTKPQNAHQEDKITTKQA